MMSTVSKYVSTTYYYIVKAQKQSYYTAADSSRVLPGLIPFAKVKAQLYELLERMWGEESAYRRSKAIRRPQWSFLYDIAKKL